MKKTPLMLFAPALAGFVLCHSAPFARASELVFLGPGSQNIYAATFDPDTGVLTNAHSVAQVRAPSFLAVSPNHKFLYAVSEGNNAANSAVSAYSIGAEGALTLLNRQPSGGSPGPCHLAVDPQGKYVVAANYAGGSIVEFPLQADGSLGPQAAFIQNEGHSVNPQRQEAPHAHCIAFDADDRHMFECDLGLDEILIYNFDPSTGALKPNDPPFYTGKPGAGPRHLAFHPNGKFAYLVSEMESSMTTLAYDAAKGTLTELHRDSLLPEGFTRSTAGEVAVHPSGKWVYGSNRGHDSIAVFACDPATGKLTLVEIHPTGGRTPRNFAIDTTGKYILAANQDSSSVVVFRIDMDTGKLQDTDVKIRVPRPECVLCLSQ